MNHNDKLREVLHLYRGCEIECEKSWYILKAVIINDENSDDEDVYVLAENEHHGESQFNLEDCKPFLRPLSSITESEEKEWQRTSTPIGEMALESAMQIHWTKRINYYRSIGIDCDGLIESGFAIDKTKL